MKKNFLLSIFSMTLLFFSTVCQAQQNNTSLDQRKPWSVMFYIGRAAKEPIGRILKGNFTSVDETLYTTELAYELSEENIIRRILRPIVSTVQVAGNVTMRTGKYDGNPPIWEFDPYLMFRWTHFPWNRYITNTFAIGEGVSYTTRVPYEEKKYNDDTSRFLNYLMFEITFALPSHPDFQVLFRIHHRSGAYGLYGAGNTGSNAIGIGIRYIF